MLAIKAFDKFQLDSLRERGKNAPRTCLLGHLVELISKITQCDTPYLMDVSHFARTRRHDNECLTSGRVRHYASGKPGSMCDSDNRSESEDRCKSAG